MCVPAGMPAPSSITSMMAWPFARTLRIVRRPWPTFGDNPCLIEFSTSGWRIMLGTTTSSVSALICLSMTKLGPNRTDSMSRYSSIEASSSRRLTK